MVGIATVESLHAEAAELTGLDDFGQQDYLEGLRVLLASLEEEAGLTQAGVEQARAELTEILVGRLLSERGWADHPEYADVPVERPVFITGMPRTATTALHRLLTVDPAHQGLPMWLGMAPRPRPPRSEWADDPYFRQLDGEIGAFVAERPGYLGVHHTAAAEVDECWLLMRQSLTTFFLEFSYHVPAYAEWLADQDLRPAYRRHRRNLQLIGSTRADRRWVLKDLGHTLGIDALLDAYPDALIVQTHRDPTTAVASLCSLMDKYAAGTSTVFRGDVIGRTALEMTHRGLSAFAEKREKHDPAHFHDVWFEDFAADPIGVIEGVYDRLGATLTEQTRERMRELQRADDERRAHRYDAADFGLSPELIRDRFGSLR